MSDLLTVMKELLPLIDHEIEQRKCGGNAEDWTQLAALSSSAHEAVRTASGTIGSFRELVERMLPFVDDALDARVHFFHESAETEDCREAVAEARALLAATASTEDKIDPSYAEEWL